MLLSKRYKKKSESSDFIPRKSLRVSKTQTTHVNDEMPSSSSNSEEDDSVASPSPRSKAKQIPELNLRIKYKVKAEDKTPQNTHVQFLQFLIKNVHPNVVIVNKRHETLKDAAVMALTSEDTYNNHFDIHFKNYPRQDEVKQAIIIQTIQTTLSLAQIKKQPGVIAFLSANKIQLSFHEWTTSTWEVNTIGFLSNFSPRHHPKEMALKTLTNKFRSTKQMPQFRIKQEQVQTEINNQTVKIQVYAIEVQSKDKHLANKLLLQHAEDPNEYVSYKMRYVSPKAFNNAIALVAQHQNDLRTVVINNVTESAYFVLEEEAKKVQHVITVHHLKDKQSMRLTTYQKEFLTVRQETNKLMPRWIDALDPSDMRSCEDKPEMAITKFDNNFEDMVSDLSPSIASLLSIDVDELTLFKNATFTKETINTPISKVPISEVTVSLNDKKFRQQQERIDAQEKRIEDLMVMLQTTEAKLDSVLQLLTGLTTLPNTNNIVMEHRSP